MAFSRNSGFVDSEQQEIIRNTRIAVAGLGGTGGAQVHALARMGFGRFNLADPDTFELVNFNRQVGATILNLGRSKCDVASETILGINPTASISLFKDGINESNVDEFLMNADIVVDSLDFYCFEERMMLYRRARVHGVWVLTAAPLGFGYTFLAFDPEGERFEDFFGFTDSMNERQKTVHFLAGLNPKFFMLKYLKVDQTKTKEKKLPSVGAAPFIIAGVTATEVMKLVLKNSNTKPAPYVYQYDAMLHKFNHGSYPNNLIRSIKRFIINYILPK